MTLKECLKEEDEQEQIKKNDLKNLSDLQKENFELKKTIEGLIKYKKVLADELRNRLAKNLKIEYEDFKSAEDMKMDSDLGENMRAQLKNIFSILIKEGIPLK